MKPRDRMRNPIVSGNAAITTVLRGTKEAPHTAPVEHYSFLNWHTDKGAPSGQCCYPLNQRLGPSEPRSALSRFDHLRPSTWAPSSNGTKRQRQNYSP